MAEDQTRARLHITYPDGQTRSIDIAQDQFDIGRSPDTDLQLPDSKISRNHARLLIEGDDIWLVDLKSANGTFVGGERLEPNEPYALEWGAGFSMGPYELQLLSPPTDTRKPDAEEEPAEEVEEEPEPEPEPVQLGAEELPAPPSPPQPPEQAPTEMGEVDPHEVFGVPEAQSSYLQYLPPIYGDHPFLGRFLLGFEAMWAPIDQMADHFDLFIQADTSPEDFTDELANWLGLRLDEKWPLEKRKALLREAGELYRWRGTRRGLQRHIEIYTGVKPEIEEPKGQGNHFRVTLRPPKKGSVERETVERIIEANKPAHTTYELEIK